MTRQEANIEILTDLLVVAKQHPDLRFQQILQIVGISDGKDRFYEESVETFDNLENNKFFKLTVDELFK